jgi:hypothetical protein
VAAIIDFVDEVAAGRIEALVADTEAMLRHDWPQIANLYVKPQGQRRGTST